MMLSGIIGDLFVYISNACDFSGLVIKMYRMTSGALNAKNLGNSVEQYLKNRETWSA